MTSCVKCKREQRPEHLWLGLCVFCAPPAQWPVKWTKPEPKSAEADA